MCSLYSSDPWIHRNWLTKYTEMQIQGTQKGKNDNSSIFETSAMSQDHFAVHEVGI